jgi:hypothetical protein
MRQRASSQDQIKATADKQAQIADTEIVKTALVRQLQQTVMSGGRLPDRGSGKKRRWHVGRHDAIIPQRDHCVRQYANNHEQNGETRPAPHERPDTVEQHGHPERHAHG